MSNTITTEEAKKILNSLATGVHPITGENIEDDTILNDSQIIQLFNNISELLIQNEQRINKINNSLFLTDEQKQLISISETSCSVSELARRIDSVVKKNVVIKFQPVWISNWLVNEGYLTIVKDEHGKKRKVESSTASSIGLSTEWRETQTQSRTRKYFAIVLSKQAQEFIINNLDEIIENRGNLHT